MGGRSHHDTRGWPSRARARHVRACLSHGLRRRRGALRRRLHGGDPLGQCGEALRRLRPRGMTEPFAVAARGEQRLPFAAARSAMTYIGSPTDDIRAGKPERYYDHVEETYGAAFRAGTPDGVETFCSLYNQIALLGNQHSIDLFVERFVPLLSLEARRRILNEVLNRPPTELGRG